MNIHRIPFHLLAAIGATAIVLPLAAAERTSEPARPASAARQDAARPSAAKADASTLSTSPMAGIPDPVRRATEQRLPTIDDLRGRVIIGAGQEELGTVDDFIVDTATGKVAYAVAKTGASDTVRLVQQSSLRLTERGFAAEIDREAFNQLEALTEAQLDKTRAAPVPVQSQRISSAVEQKATSATPATTPAIGILPPQADSVSAASTAAAAHPDPVTPATTQPVEVTAAKSTGPGLEAPQQKTHLVRASQLKEKDLRANGRSLGRIEAVGLNLEEGKAWALVQLSGQNSEAGAAYYVPLPRLQFASAEADVTTNLTPADFQHAASLQPPASIQARRSGDQESNLSPTGRPAGEQPADQKATSQPRK